MAHLIRQCLAPVLALGALLWTTTAAADPPPAAENITEYSFVDELVKGDLANPNGEVLQFRPPNERKSLIRIREHYIDRLLKSVENL